ncbi:dentin sialophosphoprotein-like [Nasonia vitripennis]|uniref:Uncharacterized protein n=1 Tax=Nasonia vitripennis TaxID=7425 RepID=A0A7M7GDJ1_NASVI|nr:dentin sialophosphoprotein-like [Nasonia vitripennis]
MVKLLILMTAFIAVTSGGKKKNMERSDQPSTEVIHRYEVIPIYTYVLQSCNHKLQLIDKIGQLIVGEDLDSESSDESGSSSSSQNSSTSSDKSDTSTSSDNSDSSTSCDNSDTSCSSSDESDSSSPSSKSNSSKSSSDSDSSSSSDYEIIIT